MMTMSKTWRNVVIAVLLVILCCGVVTCVRSVLTKQVVPEDDNSEFVTITDAVPDAILEIRYFSTYNFVCNENLEMAVKKDFILDFTKIHWVA